MADLRIVGRALTDAHTTWRTAGGRLAPVARALQGLDAGRGGRPAGRQAAERAGAARGDLGIAGQALTELASHASQIAAGFGQADQHLGQVAGAGH